MSDLCAAMPAPINFYNDVEIEQKIRLANKDASSVDGRINIDAMLLCSNEFSKGHDS